MLVDAAKAERIDDFSKTMRRHQQEMSGDHGMAILEAQRKKRTSRMFKSADTGMFVRNAEFDANTQNLWLGRTRRTATDAQRTALTIRDQGCISCGTAPNRCFSHHIKFWRNNGPTDYPNLVLVCNDCHHDIHDHGYQTIQDPDTGRWKTQPPPDPYPDTGTTTWQPAHTNSVLLN